MDFSADGHTAYASREFAGRMIEIDLRAKRVAATVVLRGGHVRSVSFREGVGGRAGLS
jgi:hypothetical protein